jgi:hypothetical protein
MVAKHFRKPDDGAIRSPCIGEYYRYLWELSRFADARTLKGHYDFHSCPITSLPCYPTSPETPTAASDYQVGKGRLGCCHPAGHHGCHHSSLPRARSSRCSSSSGQCALVDDYAGSCRIFAKAREACQGLEVCDGPTTGTERKCTEERGKHLEGPRQHSIDGNSLLWTCAPATSPCIASNIYRIIALSFRKPLYSFHALSAPIDRRYEPAGRGIIVRTRLAMQITVNPLSHCTP